jgi:hypothetical protein
MRLLRLWPAVVALSAAACQDRGPSRYVPTEETARQALEVALDAWRDGRPKPWQTPAATVQFVDTHRRPGQRLRRYVILGETPGDSSRCFAVRLTLEGPAEELRVRYVVFGIDPLWVYRHEDYDMMAHWDCETPDTKKAPTTTKPAAAKPTTKPQRPTDKLPR